MRRKIFTTIIIAGAALASLAGCNQKNSSDTYPWAGEVIAMNYETDTVTIQTGSGLTYEFTGCRDYYEGDIISVVMDNNGTPDTVLDDKIINHNYSGFYK